MLELDPTDLAAVLEQIRRHAHEENIRVTQHAQQEMAEEDVTLDQVLEALAVAQILENYPEHRRGACCLLYGSTKNGRPLHIVCTTARPLLIIITVYQPIPPRWITPTRRRNTT